MTANLVITIPPAVAGLLQWKVRVDDRLAGVNEPIALRAGIHEVAVFGSLRQSALSADVILRFSIELSSGWIRRVRLPLVELLQGYALGRQRTDRASEREPLPGR